MTDRQYRLIREQFSRQASGFGQDGLTLTNREYLAWMVEFLDPQPQDVVLDVAAGTGHLAKAIASRARHVVALDLTPEMLDEGGREAEREGLKNVKFVYGDAENLPFADGVFDLAASRFAAHHLTDPSGVVSEMIRACRFGGKVALIDLVAPAGEAEAASYNRLERLRDPSHVRALLASELRGLLQEGGLTRTRTTSRDVEVDVERWLTLSATPPARTREIRKELEADIAGVARTGMRPFARVGVLKFTQTWVIALGIKQVRAIRMTWEVLCSTSVALRPYR